MIEHTHSTVCRTSILLLLVKAPLHAADPIPAAPPRDGQITQPVTPFPDSTAPDRTFFGQQTIAGCKLDYSLGGAHVALATRAESDADRPQGVPLHSRPLIFRPSHEESPGVVRRRSRHQRHRFARRPVRNAGRLQSEDPDEDHRYPRTR